MSEDNMHVDVRVNTSSNTSGIDRLQVAIDRLNRSIRKITGAFGRVDTGSLGLDKITGKVEAQMKQAERARSTAARSAMSDLRARFTFEGRMARQQAAEARKIERTRAAAERTATVAARRRSAEERQDARDRAAATSRQAAADRAAAREAARDVARVERERAAALSRRIRLDNYRLGLRDRYERGVRRDRDEALSAARRHGRAAWDRSGDAYHASTRVGAGAALAAGAGTAAIVRRSLGAEVDADTAEIGTRQYGGLSKAQARDLRDKWAAPLAEQLGVSTSKLLTSWTDAVKLGVPAEGAKAFAGLATQTSEAWAMPFEAVSDVFGTINTLLTSQGEKFDISRIKSVANTLQHLAAKQSTTPEKLVEFLRQGAGAAQILGMSQEAGLAFGSASTSLGNRPGESGRLFDYIASRIIELPRLTKKHGEEGKQARDLVKSLGYASASEIDASRRNSPDDFLPNFIERFNKISDPRKKDSALRFFAGREWLGELGRITSGIETYKEAAKLQREAKKLDAIGEVWQIHQEKLAFVGKQFKAGWLNILGELGKELTPLARQVGDYFLGWTAKLRDGGLSARFRTAMQGFVEGLGFRDLKGMLEGVFGKPGEGSAGSIKSWGEAAKGFGQGLRDVGNTILSFFRVFTGNDATPETIGRWTARILGLSAALVVATPAIALLGALGAAIGAFAAVVAGAAAAMKAAGLMGGALSGAKVAGVGAGASASAGILGSLMSRLVPAIAAPLTLGPSREDQDRLMRRLGEEARRRMGGSPPIRQWSDPPAKVQKQSFDGSQLEGMIRPASLREADLVRGVDRLAEGVERLGARLHLAAFTTGGAGLSQAVSASVSAPAASRFVEGGGAAGGTPRALYGATPGQALPDIGFGRRGIVGGDTSPGGNEGAPEQKSGGSRAWRNNNPGNIKHGPFAVSMGATGSDGVFAKFPSYETGRKAQEKLLFEGKNYRDLTLGQAIRRWAPASENNVPAYIAAMGGDSSTRMRDYTPEQRAKLLDAMQRHEGWKVGTVTGGKNPPGMAEGEAKYPGGNPADVAGRFLGMGEHNAGRSQVERFVGGNIMGAANAWCARFVNASLKAVGQTGTGSAVANSFLRWGKEISAEMAQKGDVLVQHRGRGANQTGGHVGMATGKKRIQNGQLEIEMLSGNESDQVKTDWKRASGLSVRRGSQAAQVERAVEDIAEGFKSTGWQKRNAFGGVDPMGKGVGPDQVRDTLVGRYLGNLNQGGKSNPGQGFGPGLVDSVAPAEMMAKRAPMPPMGGGGRGGSSVTAPITIQNNGDAEHTANQVQRRLMDATNYRTHDIGFDSV